MPKGIFVTATDTGVGKTIATAAIISKLRRQGINVGVMKPLETGCAFKYGILEPADGRFLRNISGVNDPLELIAPLRFSEPLAPYVAARREGSVVNIQRVLDAYRHISERHDFIVVEGIGGVLVPLAGKATGERRAYFVTDLIKDLRLPVVVVARPALGTLNHTLLTVHKLLDEGADVKGLIINFSAPPDGSVAEATNPEALKELCPIPVIGVIPYMTDISLQTIETEASECFNVDVLIR